MWTKALAAIAIATFAGFAEAQAPRVTAAKGLVSFVIPERWALDPDPAPGSPPADIAYKPKWSETELHTFQSCDVRWKDELWSPLTTQESINAIMAAAAATGGFGPSGLKTVSFSTSRTLNGVRLVEAVFEDGPFALFHFTALMVVGKSSATSIVVGCATVLPDSLGIPEIRTAYEADQRDIAAFLGSMQIHN